MAKIGKMIVFLLLILLVAGMPVSNLFRFQAVPFSMERILYALYSTIVLTVVFLTGIRIGALRGKKETGRIEFKETPKEIHYFAKETSTQMMFIT